MRTGRPKVELLLSDEERSQLQSFARSRSLAAALSNRARIALSSADGELNSAGAERLKLTKAIVGKWRTRYIERRIPGLYDDVCPGKPRTIDDERVAHLIKTTLQTKPADGSTHWSVRSVAAETGISKTSVARHFQIFGLQPHRTEGFKLSNAPFFIEKLRDVVGLYLSPPDNALVICVDEKSQCQALEGAQPMPPMGFGYVEGVTHDYRRHGTTTLFAALNVLNGAVLAACKLRHRHQEFLSFLREIDKAVPTALDVHCICDNYATHSHPKVKAWLASKPRWHMHFIPTYSSWLNQVERFFSLITDKAIRRGSFTSVKQLVQRIDHFVAAHNANCQPFKGTATADSILENCIGFAHASAGQDTSQCGRRRWLQLGGATHVAALCLIAPAETPSAAVEGEHVLIDAGRHLEGRSRATAGDVRGHARGQAAVVEPESLEEAGIRGEDRQDR
jgi:putative transposase